MKMREMTQWIKKREEVRKQTLNWKASKKEGKTMDFRKLWASSLEHQEDGEGHGLSPGAWGLWAWLASVTLGSLAGVRLSLWGRLDCSIMGPWLSEPKDFRILLTKTPYGAGGGKKRKGVWGGQWVSLAISVWGWEEQSVWRTAIEKADMSELWNVQMS